MTKRSLDASIVSELGNVFLKPVQFLELQFDSGTVYLHDDLGQITTTTPSATFEGVGDLGQIGTIKETERLVPSGVSVVLSGIDTDLLDEARNQDYVDRTAIIYIGMRNLVTGVMVSDPSEIFYGYMDQMRIISGDGPATIQLDLEHEQKRWEKAPLGIYDDATMQTEFSGDLFFEFLPHMISLTLEWGGRSANSGVSFGAPPRGDSEAPVYRR